MKVFVNGYGFLGKLLARELMDHRVSGVKLVGVARSSGYVHRDEGLSPDDLKGDLSDSEVFTKGSALSLIREGAFDVLVELTPTNLPSAEPGLSNIRAALSNGIDVVTANKAPIALRYRELTDLASSAGKLLLFDSTVGGGIPLITLRRLCMRGDDLLSIRGILNGTTNYILSRMQFEGLTFELALREAQNLGIAERDPSLDVNGYDTALKLLILANSLMGLDRGLEDVRVAGITRVTQEAVAAARESNMSVKLIGSVDGEGKLLVAPRLVKANDPLCVHGTLNAVTFRFRIARDLTLIGHGAGEPTVSSLLNDLHQVVEFRLRGATSA
ncbi:MAG: homoserine dehydrogenase [Thaumarchaeota archaeon]|nr:homoserine dehydrogenase [Candidatus Calditenuaceae archaeon]MDW8041989.1 homoserine dehydrogenase [Nitrososphaerota archaeon]